MMPDFPRVPLGKIGTPVCRIGLSATYRPGRQTVFKALDEGLNYFLYFGFDHHMTSVLRETVPPRRDQYVLATGAYNCIWWHQNLRRTLERRLRQMRTDYIDVFHFLGVTRRAHFTPQVREELQAVRESGLVRAVVDGRVLDAVAARGTERAGRPGPGRRSGHRRSRQHHARRAMDQDHPRVLPDVTAVRGATPRRHLLLRGVARRAWV